MNIGKLFVYFLVNEMLGWLDKIINVRLNFIFKKK